MGLSHLRILKQHPEKKEAAFRKCDKRQLEALEEVLALVRVEVEKPEKPETPETQMVPFQPAGDSQPSEQAEPAEPSPSYTPSQSASPSKKTAGEELQPMKRPSATPSTLNLAEEEDEEVLKKHIPNQVVELAMKRAMELSPDEFPRETRRQRTTSNAYHRSEQILMKDGMTKDDAQAVGRVAGRMAGAEFDKSWPLAKAKAKSSSSKAKAAPKKKKKTQKKTRKQKIEKVEVDAEDDTKNEEGIDEGSVSDSKNVD
eukprot:s3046_g5.t1